jgi:hypothetical protein
LTTTTNWRPCAAALTLLLTMSAVPAQAHDNQVEMIVEFEKRCFVTNGLPDHDTGTFPNKGNPNTILAQKLRLCMPSKPPNQIGTVAQYLKGSIGIAINGVQFRPGTADYFDAESPRGFSHDPSSGWNLDGMGAREKLGIDHHNAHVDNRGLYHYHGVSDALAKSTRALVIGYAADGYDIHYVGARMTSSYQLKRGHRPFPPGGVYDGTYNEDWEFVKGSGRLDECNGTKNLYGRYVYYATDTYPFFPRCLWGKISDDFKRSADGPRSSGGRGPGGRPGEDFPPRGGPPPPRR